MNICLTKKKKKKKREREKRIIEDDIIMSEGITQHCYSVSTMILSAWDFCLMFYLHIASSAVLILQVCSGVCAF